MSDNPDFSLLWFQKVAQWFSEKLGNMHTSLEKKIQEFLVVD